MVESSSLFLQKKELLLEEAKPNEMDLLLEKNILLISGEKVYFDPHWSSFFSYNSYNSSKTKEMDKRKLSENNYPLPTKLFILQVWMLNSDGKTQ